MIRIFSVCALLISDASASYCSTLHSDYLHRQLEGWNSSAPFTEESGTKHIPYTTVYNGTATVTVGNGDVEGGVYHPMIASNDPNKVHWVTHIYVVDQNDEVIQMKAMDPTVVGVPATFVFIVPEGVTQLVAYEFCNIHGLWKGPTFNLQNSGELIAACEKDDVDPNAYESWGADFFRRQAFPPFEEANPYTHDGKHAPYITLNGSNGQVVVGVEGNMHVMNGGDAETQPHWITDIYVVDQDQKIIAFQAMDPTNVDTAIMDFIVPESATELTAYEWCSIHGLWKGPTVNVANAENTVESKIGIPSTFFPSWIYVYSSIHGLLKGPTVKFVIEDDDVALTNAVFATEDDEVALISGAHSNFFISWIHVECLLGSIFSVFLA